MLTYSIFTGTIFESSKLSDISAIINQLPDNTQKLISPKDVRDAIFTTWDTIPFKSTLLSGSSSNYIGIDGTEGGLDLKIPIYLGKRQLAGQDIMSYNLFNPPSNIPAYGTDIFVYNMKSDSNLTQQNTKVTFLAGTDSSIFAYAPNMEAIYVSSLTSSYIDFNLNNEFGNVNLLSSTKRVSLNGIQFPTVIETTSATAGYVLSLFKNGGENFLTWTQVSSNSLGASGSTVSIIGSPVLVNGYPLEFTDTTPTPLTLGGIIAGSTFDNVPLVEMVRRMLYPYIAPSITIFNLSLTSGDSGGYINNGTGNLYTEVGNTTFANLRFNYGVVKKTLPITQILVTPDSGNDNPGAYVPVTTSLSGFSSLTLNYVTGNSPTPPGGQIGSTTFTISVSDGTQSVAANATVTRVLPYFYGTSTTATSNTATINSLLGSFTKRVGPNPGGGTLTLPLVGNTVCIYLIVPFTWNNITSIIDDNNQNVTGAFSLYGNPSPLTLTSPNGYWVGNYKAYIYTAGGANPTTTSIGGNGYTTPVNYRFNF